MLDQHPNELDIHQDYSIRYCRVSEREMACPMVLVAADADLLGKELSAVLMISNTIG